MRSIQYSDFVDVFNCLTALHSNVGANDCTYSTVLKVPFEKAAPLHRRTKGRPAPPN